LSPNVPRLKNSGTSLVGDKTQTANPNKQNKSYYQGILSLFDAEPSAFVIWLLWFVISSFAKKLVLECFPDKNIRGQIYRVRQDFTIQVLKWKLS